MKKLIVILFMLSASVFSAQAQQTLTLGIFPHLPKHKLYEMYFPVAENLSTATGVEIELKTLPTFSQFEAALSEEVYDIALIQPFDYPKAHDEHHYLPLASRDDSLSAILVAKRDSRFNSLTELKNRTIANPATSAAVSKLTDRLMRQQGFDPREDFVRIYKNNHFSCLQAVLINVADACGTSLRALKHFEDEKLSSRFKVIAESEPIPHVLFVAHSRVTPEIRHKIQATILGWKNSPEGREVLKGSRMPHFKAVVDADYDVLRDR